MAKLFVAISVVFYTAISRAVITTSHSDVVVVRLLSEGLEGGLLITDFWPFVVIGLIFS